MSILGLPTNRMIVMGILNVTPDSFADGGRFNTTELAVNRAFAMIDEGVDIIDIGGESTRPGAERISAQEEQSRVLPVSEALSKANVIMSIDTKQADTARKAIERGAHIVNDVSAGLADSQMLSSVAALGCPFIAMHSRGNSQEMGSLAVYQDVVKEVVVELTQRVEEAISAGIHSSNLILDPGLGFAKEAHHNWALLNDLEAIKAIGYPVLIGASRKRFLGSAVNAQTPDEREEATVALTALIANKGIWGVRVHSVKPHRDAISIAGFMS